MEGTQFLRNNARIHAFEHFFHHHQFAPFDFHAIMYPSLRHHKSNKKIIHHKNPVHRYYITRCCKYQGGRSRRIDKCVRDNQDGRYYSSNRIDGKCKEDLEPQTPPPTPPPPPSPSPPPTPPPPAPLVETTSAQEVTKTTEESLIEGSL